MIACRLPTDSDKQMADQTGILAGSLLRSASQAVPANDEMEDQGIHELNKQRSREE